jgi:predicted pyridoxine 5'-phosphate oxidase superfamily flavin-nucleotide-binding protein
MDLKSRLSAELTMNKPSSDIAFTPTVKAIQTERGSREAYSMREARGGFRTAIDEDLIHFLAQVDTAYLATANANGQPYAQHRGGPKGFIHAINGRTLGFADFTGNRQYITTGNLAENDKAFLFLMDYAHRRRVKLWGSARVVRGDAALLTRLMPEGYRARAEQAILFTVEAWDVNCPQHIPQKVDAGDAAAAIGRLEDRIAILETENARLNRRIEAVEKPGCTEIGAPGSLAGC